MYTNVLSAISVLSVSGTATSKPEVGQLREKAGHRGIWI